MKELLTTQIAFFAKMHIHENEKNGNSLKIMNSRSLKDYLSSV